MNNPNESLSVANTPNTQLIARWIGTVYVVGASIAIIWTLIPHAQTSGDTVVRAMAALALVSGVVLVAGGADRCPPWAFHIVLASVQLVITIGYVAVPDPGNDTRLFYIWATPIAAFFFRPIAGAAHATLVAALLAYGLWVHDTPLAEAARIWMMTVGVLVTVTTLVAAAAKGVRRRDTQLSHAATHDPLTGLANRVLLARRTVEALRRRRTTNGQVFMLLADLDRFKLLNDSQGHFAGDELLTCLAGRFAENVPANSIVSRLGGDEFAILVEDPDNTMDPVMLAENLARSWVEPIELERGHVRTSACIGVAVATDDDQSSSLLRKADAAMYRAKSEGRSGICLYDLHQRVEIGRRRHLVQMLFDSVDKHQLSLVYQPIVDLQSGDVRAAEALVRWEHPVMGIIHPGEFIPLAEGCGMIDEIGLWVMGEALEQMARWRAAGVIGSGFTVHVNVSGAQLHDEFASTVAGLLATHGLEPGALMMELTETVLMRAGAEATDVLRAIVELGVPLALDDFGTGYSSLSYLHQATVHTVKIDQSFVGGMSSDSTRQAIVEAVVALTRALGLIVVAEGVDSLDQIGMLTTMGCRLGQGFLLARPLPPSGMADFLAARQPSAPTVRQATRREPATASVGA
ncbi:MAG: bifunctional diguanylate cyclase/phosphodiesterase [Ilumatobacteraceae bacterium]